ncbi:hypothetical protein SEA_ROBINSPARKLES_112 [Gordonia phage RobinSparkles]|nr:hypothetical protein SEA_ROBINSPARKLES_112 [Gordonia phage RobinSparkles]
MSFFLKAALFIPTQLALKAMQAFNPLPNPFEGENNESNSNSETH